MKMITETQKWQMDKAHKNTGTIWIQIVMLLNRLGRLGVAHTFLNKQISRPDSHG